MGAGFSSFPFPHFPPHCWFFVCSCLSESVFGIHPSWVSCSGVLWILCSPRGCLGSSVKDPHAGIPSSPAPRWLFLGCFATGLCDRARWGWVSSVQETSLVRDGAGHPNPAPLRSQQPGEAQRHPLVLSSTHSSFCWLTHHFWNSSFQHVFQCMKGSAAAKTDE